MPKSPQIGSPVCVTWEDAYSDDERVVETDLEITVVPMVIELLGFVVKDGPDGILVAREKYVDGRYRSTQYIPRGMVRKVQVL